MGTIKGEDVFAKQPYKDLKITSRNCLFPEEGDSKLFAHYTKSNCLLECAWKHAENTCGCRPWHVPSENGAKMCFVVGNVCFNQVMEKIRVKKIFPTCSCKSDCVGSRYTLTVDNVETHERLSSGFMRHPIFFERTSTLVTTQEKHGSDVKAAGWYNLGEYLVDRNFSILPHDPFLDMAFPRPLPLKGVCGWPIDRQENSKRDCEVVDYEFNKLNSEKMIIDRQKNFFKVAIYFEPDQSVITKITKDAKMTWSDKISWIGGNMGLFTGFSVISGIELLYWIIFKVFFHKKDVESSDGEDKKELGWRERRSQNDEDSKVSSDKEDIEAGPALAKPKSSSCCSSCQALASTAKLEAMEAEIAEMKMAMKARSSDGPAGMVFDAVFNTPDVGSAPVVDPPPAEPPKQEPAAEEKIPKVDVEPKVVVVEEIESSPAVEKEEPPPATPVPPLTLVQEDCEAKRETESEKQPKPSPKKKPAKKKKKVGKKKAKVAPATPAAEAPQEEVTLMMQQ